MTKGDSIGVNKNINLINTLDMQNGARQNGVANVKLSDTATVNKLLNSAQAIKARPANLRFTKFMWAAKPESNTPDNLTLYAIRGTANNKAPLDGAVKMHVLTTTKSEELRSECRWTLMVPRYGKHLQRKTSEDLSL